MHYPQVASILALEGAMGLMDTLYNIDTIQPFDQVGMGRRFDLGRSKGDNCTEDHQVDVVCGLWTGLGNDGLQSVPRAELRVSAARDLERANSFPALAPAGDRREEATHEDAEQNCVCSRQRGV